MRSIFTYARAATKVIDLLGEECGCKRETLRCSSRLESDLGVYGSDVYDLLEAMERRLHVDMSEFDSHDCISPEYMTLGDYVLMFVIMGGGMALAGLVNFLWPALPPVVPSFGRSARCRSCCQARCQILSQGGSEA
jgi:hypothetical protein